MPTIKDKVRQGMIKISMKLTSRNNKVHIQNRTLIPKFKKQIFQSLETMQINAKNRF